MANLVDIIADAEKQISDLLGKEAKIFVDTLHNDNNGKIPAYIYTVLGDPDKNGIMALSIARFSLAELPGCCGVCVSYHASVSPGMRKKGFGTLLCGIRKDIARVLGYGCLLCTDVVTNETQQRILSRNGWKSIHSFRNPRTWNNVNIHVVNL